MDRRRSQSAVCRHLVRAPHHLADQVDFFRGDDMRRAGFDEPRGPCTHWKAPPFHGARRKRSLAGADHTLLAASIAACAVHATSQVTTADPGVVANASVLAGVAR